VHAPQLGAFYDMAAAFQVELALPNCYWFEMPWRGVPRPSVYERKFRVDADGYVHAQPIPAWDIRSIWPWSTSC